MDEQRPWHRLFGLSWMDFFRGMPVTVEMEKDLSLKQQLLDLIFRKGTGILPCRLPDGFEDLATHNLVSFKSYQEALDGWALNEFIGHYVNYKKQVSPTMQNLLPETDFRLFAVSVRFPQSLAQQTMLTPVQQGVYEVRHFTGRLRLVVVHQLPQEEHNAMLHLFSAQMNLVRYGAEHYRMRSEETSTLLHQLFQRYLTEAPLMPDQLEEFTRQTINEILRSLPAKKRLEGLSREERLEGLSADDLRSALSSKERLEGLSPEELRAALSPEERLKGLSLEDMLAALSPEARDAFVRQLKGNGSSEHPG